MLGVSTNSSELVVRHEKILDFVGRRYSGWHAAAPILLVLTSLTVGGYVVATQTAPGAVGLIFAVLAILMVAAGGLMFFSLYATGEIIEARFDRSKEVVDLFYRGPTAYTTWTLPFNRISGAKMAMRYGEAGSKISTPVLELTNGRSIALPDATTWDEIEAIRAMISKDVDMTAAAWAKKNSARTQGRPRR
jgi:hypothetical protein